MRADERCSEKVYCMHTIVPDQLFADDINDLHVID